MILPSTGLFALIESLEDPLPHPIKRSKLVVKGSKCLTTKQQKKRRQDGRSVRAPNLYLVPVRSIDEPISAIPNIGGDPGDFIFVRPVNTWSDCFSDYITMCHCNDYHGLAAILCRMVGAQRHRPREYPRYQTRGSSSENYP
jgi:hypothetical protein